jgi:hypothetical protein
MQRGVQHQASDHGVDEYSTQHVAGPGYMPHDHPLFVANRVPKVELSGDRAMGPLTRAGTIGDQDLVNLA